MVSPQFDISLKLVSDKRRFRLLQQQGRKLWTVREVPPSPELNLGGANKGGLPPERLLPFSMEDWSLGAGLLRFTPQTTRPGHTLRYSDGFNIDTSEPGIIRHGPAIESVGTTASDVLFSVLLNDIVFFVTNQHVYSWDGTTLTLEYTHGSADFTDAVVHGTELFIASGADYLHGDSSDWQAGSPATVSTAADFWLTLGTQLWRSFSTNQVSASTNPSAGSPVWAAGITVGGGEPITKLFSISGLLGVATEDTLYILDSDGGNIELDTKLRNRRSSSAFSIAGQSGNDVWFSDGKDIIRLLVKGFEVFEIRPDGPFYSTDEIPQTFPAKGNPGISGIQFDLDAIYVLVTRGSDKFIYKGVEVARDIYVWSPLIKQATADPDFLGIHKLAVDASPRLYWNSGTAVHTALTQWTDYADTWELHTTYFAAGLESWTKFWSKFRAFIEISGTADLTIYYRVDEDTAWTQFGVDALSTTGNNSISLTAPIVGRRIQLRFAGTDGTGFVHLKSFLLEGILRADHARLFQFTVIADSKTEADFLYSLRTDNDSFITITDRFGTARTAFVLPGFPVEIETMDEPLHEPVRAYQIMAQEVT